MCSANAESALSLNRDKMKSINCCYIAFAVFAFVSNALGGYNTPSSNAGSAYSTPSSANINGTYIKQPTLIFNSDRSPIGLSTSLGEDLISVNNMSQKELRKTLSSEIYKSAEDSFGAACKVNNGSGKEIMEVWYKDKDGYLRHARIDDGNGNSTNVKASQDKLNDIRSRGEILAYVHNHPGGECGAWPSNVDAKNLNVEQYIVDCKQNSQKKVARLSSEDGKVYAVSADGSEQEWTHEEYKKQYSRCAIPGNNDKHSAYDPRAFDVRRKKRENDDEQRKKDGNDERKVNDVANVEIQQTNNVVSTFGPNGHKWVMRGEQPISFDDIVLGTPWQGKKNDMFIVALKQPYFVFDAVFVYVADGLVRSVWFDRGGLLLDSPPMPNQRAIESMAIGELICKDIEKQCGVKLENDKLPHHRQYQWNGRGFRRIALRINNENDDSPGNASFSLTVDGGYEYSTAK